MLEREPLERLAADGQLRAFRHEGFWDCMDTYKDAVLLNDLWDAGGAPWKVWAMMRLGASSRAPTACSARGSCRALLERGRRGHRPAPRPDAPRSRWSWTGWRRACTSCSGDVTDGSLIERALGEYEVDSVFHLAAQTIVGTANRSPALDLRGQRPRHLDACSRPAARTRSPTRRRRRLGQGLRRPRRAALPRGLPAASRASPTTSSKAATDMIARSYWHTYGLPVAVTRFANIYGGGDLNRSRLIPEAVAAALDGPAAGDPLRRQPRARLPLRRRRRRPPIWRSPTRCDGDGARARPSTPAAGRPHAVARGGAS